MFHTREATEPLDRVYALLSLASDIQARGIFRPQYHVSWQELFIQLAGYSMGNMLSVKALSENVLVIEGRGSVFASVVSIRPSSKGHHLQTITVSPVRAYEDSNYMKKCGAEWIIQQTGKIIRPKDLLCIIQGAPRPILMRRRGDYFVVIALAITAQREHGGTKNPDHAKTTFISTATSKRDVGFTAHLVWEWQENTSVEQTGAYCVDALSTAERLYEMARALNDAGQVDECRSTIRKLQGHLEMIEPSHPLLLASQDLMTLVREGKRAKTARQRRISRL